MQELFDKLHFYSTTFFHKPKVEYQRAIFNKIDFSQKLIALIGAKGVGKTTLLQQYYSMLISTDKNTIKEVLYISLDNPILNDIKLLEIAEYFYQIGGKVLLIDEIHYQKGFEHDIKTSYDFFDLKIIFSGSSAIALDHADLSRRAVIYHIPILSLREYLELTLSLSLEDYSLDQIVKDHIEISFDINSKLKPLQYMSDYFTHGAYPFFMEGKEVYLFKLTEAINKVIESDLPLIQHIDHKNIVTLRKILVMLCESPPGELNMASLSRDAAINIRTLYNYIFALNAGELIRVIGVKTKGRAKMNKPDKILLNNPNLFQVLCLSSNIGALRESFFTSMLCSLPIKYVKTGDYIINNHYLFEIGGKNKDFSQIKGIPNSHLVLDNITTGGNRKIPLWLFGFLY